MTLDTILWLVNMIPQARPAVAALRLFEPYIKVAQPVITAAIAEGRPAFEAAEAAAPQLAKAVRDLMLHMPTPTGVTPEVHVENVTRALVGVPTMTPDEERRWMDNATRDRGGG